MVKQWTLFQTISQSVVSDVLWWMPRFVLINFFFPICLFSILTSLECFKGQASNFIAINGSSSKGVFISGEISQIVIFQYL